MVEETDICTATFFRIKGKDVVTEKEFVMEIGLNLRWMSVKEAGALLKFLATEGCITVSEGCVRPAKNYSALQIPVAYRPSENLRKRLFERLPSGISNAKSKKKTDSNDAFSVLLDTAIKIGIPKKKFVSECNRLKQKLGIGICPAALIILRDTGTDVSKLYAEVYAQISRL